MRKPVYLSLVNAVRLSDTNGSSNLCVEKIFRKHLIVLSADGEVTGTTYTHFGNVSTKTKK